MIFGKPPDFTSLPIVLSGLSIRRARRRTVEVGPDGVSVSEKGLLTAAPWREPLDAYEGVGLRAVMQDGAPRYYVELPHEDAARTVLLYRSYKFELARGAWLAAARSLGLPAVEETPVGRLSRRGAELDQSIRALVAAGRLAAPPAIRSAPPFPMSLKRAPSQADNLSLDAREVVVPFLGPLEIAAFVLFFGLAGWICLVGGPGPDILLARLPQYLVCGGLILMLPVLLVLALERQRIVVTQDEVSVLSTLYRYRRRATTIAFDALHTVVTPAPAFRWTGRTQIILASDTACVAIPGLTRRQAEWLGGFLMAAAAGNVIPSLANSPMSRGEPVPDLGPVGPSVGPRAGAG